MRIDDIKEEIAPLDGRSMEEARQRQASLTRQPGAAGGAIDKAGGDIP
jgi:hypothetical protein